MREKYLLKILAMMARIIGKNVEGFYPHSLDSMIDRMYEKGDGCNE